MFYIGHYYNPIEIYDNNLSYNRIDKLNNAYLNKTNSIPNNKNYFQHFYDSHHQMNLNNDKKLSSSSNMHYNNGYYTSQHVQNKFLPFNPHHHQHTLQQRSTNNIMESFYSNINSYPQECVYLKDNKHLPTYDNNKRLVRNSSKSNNCTKCHQNVKRKNSRQYENQYNSFDQQNNYDDLEEMNLLKSNTNLNTTKKCNASKMKTGSRSKTIKLKASESTKSCSNRIKPVRSKSTNSIYQFNNVSSSKDVNYYNGSQTIINDSNSNNQNGFCAKRYLNSKVVHKSRSPSR